MEKTMSRDLTEGNVFKQLITFSIPIVAANLLQILYTLVDMIVVGNFVGTSGLSAVSSAGTVMMLFTNFSMGFSSAGQIVISQFQGKQDKDSVNKTVGTLLSFVVLMGIVLSCIALPTVKFLLNLINTPVEAMDYSMDYLRVCAIGFLFIFGYSSIGAILRGMGDSKHPLLFIAIATITNIILDVLFCGPMRMGTFGAGLATVIGQGMSFLFSLGYLYKHKEAFGFDFKPKSFKMDKHILWILIKIGIPVALQHIAVNISTMYVTASINSYGVIVSALSGIGDKLRMAIGIFTASIGTGVSTMTGQNIGAGNYDRVRKIVIQAFLLLIVFCVILGVLGVIFSKSVISLFDDDPRVLEMAPRFMVITLVTFIAFAFYTPFISLVNGLGYASFAFILGIIDGFVARCGLVFLLGKVFNFGIWGVWWAATLASYVGVAIGFYYFFSGKWKKRKSIT